MKIGCGSWKYRVGIRRSGSAEPVEISTSRGMDLYEFHLTQQPCPLTSLTHLRHWQTLHLHLYHSILYLQTIVSVPTA
jgi:hypothetical protein